MTVTVDQLRAAQRDLIRLSRELRDDVPAAVPSLAAAYAEIDHTIKEGDRGTSA